MFFTKEKVTRFFAMSKAICLNSETALTPFFGSPPRVALLKNLGGLRFFAQTNFCCNEVHVARINIDHYFFSDLRIAKLARCSKENIMTTRGRLLCIWRHCYEMRSEELEIDDIDEAAEWDEFGKTYGSFLVKSGLAEAVDNSKIRLKGIAERIIYLKNQGIRGKIGGKRSAEIRKTVFGTAQPASKQTLPFAEACASKSRSERFVTPKQPPKPTSSSSSCSNLISTSELNTNLVVSPNEPTAVCEVHDTDQGKKGKNGGGGGNGHEVTPKMVADLWNQKSDPRLPKLRDTKKLPPDRVARLSARIKSYPLKKDWEDAIACVNEWDFGLGENDRGWLANFDWFISTKGRKAFEGCLQARVLSIADQWLLDKEREDREKEVEQ